MRRKKWAATSAALIVIGLIAAGVFALAAEYGTQNDPLVSLSYINSVFAPEMQKKAESMVSDQVNAVAKRMEAQLQDFAAENLPLVSDESTLDAVSQKLAAQFANQKTGTATFQLVKVASGKTLICSVGTEALLRLGNATCVSSGATGLIDTTTGGVLAGGKALARNHLYLCTINGRGIKASGEITLLVRGTYTIQ